jgi:hypothetical protein
VTRPAHLARRFVGSLRPGGPPVEDVTWARSVLTDPEWVLWCRLSNPDRRHSAAVARRVERALADTPYAGDPRWPAAALLHDVGKLDAGLGVLGRVGATLADAAAGHAMAEDWSTRRGVTRRVGLYLRHPELGATRVRVAGGREEVAAWAAAHHRPEPVAVGVPADVAAVLVAADDD